MRLRRSIKELAALPKLQYKKVLSYGYQLLLQFLCSDLGMYVYVDRDVSGKTLERVKILRRR
jgi:hypothetical protein